MQDRIARYGAPASVKAASSAGSGAAAMASLPSLSVLTWNLWFQVRMQFPHTSALVWLDERQFGSELRPCRLSRQTL
jgi:hypothetical protein